MTELLPEDAPNDGARRLRELMQRMTTGQIARKVKAHRSTVWDWARGTMPRSDHRGSAEALLGIPVDAWRRKPTSPDATGH